MSEGHKTEYVVRRRWTGERNVSCNQKRREAMSASRRVLRISECLPAKAAATVKAVAVAAPIAAIKSDGGAVVAIAIIGAATPVRAAAGVIGRGAPFIPITAMAAR